MRKENLIGQITTAVGILSIISGFIVGLVMSETPVDGYRYVTEKSWAVFWAWVLLGSVNGLVFIGFGEIIFQLDSIRKNLQSGGEESSNE